MLSHDEAKKRVENEVRDSKAQASADYNGLILVRVEFADPNEANYDPFFSVNPETGAVEEFSIVMDGNPQEVAKAFAAAG